MKLAVVHHLFLSGVDGSMGDDVVPLEGEGLPAIHSYQIQLVGRYGGRGGPRGAADLRQQRRWRILDLEGKVTDSDLRGGRRCEEGCVGAPQ